MNILDIIEKKKCAQALDEAEIAYFINGICNGTVADYQASALLMAICINGMSDVETAILTEKMATSGDTLDLSALSPTADKHSTGGVGDKTSLIVAPIVAACGVRIAKMSGRGLAHTGGTIDKLESIPGFQTQLSEAAFLEQVRRTGIAIIAQSANLVPADKILYALRDVTATVNSIPLIASSIMSKKLAAGADIIELDVKTGSGAFMKTEEQAKELAAAMVKIGKANGKKTSAVITDMNTPLGTHIGNALEILEVIAVLDGQGPNDLRELCLALSAGILAAAKGISRKQALAHAAAALKDGSALQKFKEMVAAQSGDVDCIDHPERLKIAAVQKEIPAAQSGYIASINTEAIGRCAAVLGAGRFRKEDTIDLGAGIILAKKTGDNVRKGEPLATLFTNRPQILKQAETMFHEAIVFSPEKPPQSALIKEVIE